MGIISGAIKVANVAQGIVNSAVNAGNSNSAIDATKKSLEGKKLPFTNMPLSRLANGDYSSTEPDIDETTIEILPNGYTGSRVVVKSDSTPLSKLKNYFQDDIAKAQSMGYFTNDWTLSKLRSYTPEPIFEEMGTPLARLLHNDFSYKFHSFYSNMYDQADQPQQYKENEVQDEVNELETAMMNSIKKRMEYNDAAYEHELKKPNTLGEWVSSVTGIGATSYKPGIFHSIALTLPRGYGGVSFVNPHVNTSRDTNTVKELAKLSVDRYKLEKSNGNPPASGDRYASWDEILSKTSKDDDNVWSRALNTLKSEHGKETISGLKDNSGNIIGKQLKDLKYGDIFDDKNSNRDGNWKAMCNYAKTRAWQPPKKKSK